MNAPIDSNHHKGLLTADSVTGEPRALTSTDVNGDPALNIYAPASLVSEAYDYIAITYPTDTTEVYAFKTGGSSGSTVATLTLTYTDSTKDNLSSVART